MRARSAPASRAPRSAASVDLVLCTSREGRLAVLLSATGGAARERWMIPWFPLSVGRPLDDIATQGATRVSGAKPAWMGQAGVFDAVLRHPAGTALSVAYVGVMPNPGGDPPAGATWFSLTQLPPLPPRQRAMIRTAVDLLRDRLDSAPIAFRLLPPAFTLGELQQIYELLIGRRLHKASFRRALQAAYLVQPTDAWRSEGRGRPAQLFRYAPRRRRGGPRRSVRFELLSG